MRTISFVVSTNAITVMVYRSCAKPYTDSYMCVRHVSTIHNRSGPHTLPQRVSAKRSPLHTLYHMPSRKNGRVARKESHAQNSHRETSSAHVFSLHVQILAS